MFMAGLGVNFEYDSRGIIALPTLRQLGFMSMTISIGLFSLAFFHLLTHALFKVLLIVCAGSVIHSIGTLMTFIKWVVCLFICLLLLHI
jgi:NADH-ubiquinone oxidoreductase chain 5